MNSDGVILTANAREFLRTSASGGGNGFICANSCLFVVNDLKNSADSSNAFQVVMLLISKGRAASAAASAWAPELDSLTGLDSA